MQKVYKYIAFFRFENMVETIIDDLITANNNNTHMLYLDSSLAFYVWMFLLITR